MSVAQCLADTTYREITLRRLVDSILFAMVYAQNWLFRRFTIDLTIHDVDPVVLQRTIRLAAERNRDNRMAFNLVSDLSTVVQIGDLIEIDLTAERARKWRVVELKEGRMNEVLSGLIAREAAQPAEAVVETVKGAIGEKAGKQAQRMMRQARRLRELERIVDSDCGIDPLINMETVMTANTVTLDDYRSQIERVYTKARREGCAAAELDGCLRIVGITRDAANDCARGIAGHQFFHMAHRERDCALSKHSDASARSKEEDMLKTVPYFVDVVDYNLRTPISDPIFMLSPHEMVFNLILERVRIFVQFDCEAFFHLAERDGIKMGWVRGNEAESIKKLSMRFPGTDAWGAFAELPSGERMTLLVGFLCRPYANFATPRQMISMMKDFPQELATTLRSGVREN
jgi:hypothetical protein